EQAGIAGQFRGRRPRYLERLSRLDGVPFALGNHADEVALAHNPPAGNVLDRAFIDTRRLCTGAKGALTTRQHDTAMQHSWFGVTLVSSWAARSWLMSRSSSSPAICSMPVVLPWPSSHLPKYTVAVLSACMAIHESMAFGSGGPATSPRAAAADSGSAPVMLKPTTRAPPPLSKSRREKLVSLRMSVIASLPPF